MKLCHFLVVVLLNGVLLNGSQLVLPVRIAMGGDLSHAQSNQSAYAYPKIEAAPPCGSCNGTPLWYPTHDTPLILFVAALVF